MKKEKRVVGKVVLCAFVLLMLGSVFAGVMPATAQPAESSWPMFRHDVRHTGYNSAETQLKPPLQKLWHFETGGGVTASPAVANGAVYIASGDGNVYALDATTGDELWHFDTGGPLASSPAIANGVVFIKGFDNVRGLAVWAIDANSGQELWFFVTGRTGHPERSSPAVANGAVYVGSCEGNVYALDATTGDELWHFDAGTCVESSPAIANGIVYIGGGSNDGNLYALNALTGQQLWHFKDDYVSHVFVDSSPAVANGVVYTIALDLCAIDALTGEKRWRFRHCLGSSSPAVANGIVYVGCAHGFYAIDATTGDELWDFETGRAVVSSPAVANGAVYIGFPDGSVYAFGSETEPTIPTLKCPLGGNIENRQILLGFGDIWTWTYCGGLPKKHTGVDLNACVGENVYAAYDGKIVKIYDLSPVHNWGKGVIIEHTGFTTSYMHVNPVVNEGDCVIKGQKISTIANIGGNEHLHFGVRSSTYSDISKRGALPQKHGDSDYQDGRFTGCKSDPLFPEKFVDPMKLKYETTPQDIPEFTTIAIPVAAIIGLMFLFSRRKRKKEEV